MASKAPLMALLSALIDVPNVEIQSRIENEVVSFSGPIRGLRYSADTDPLIVVEAEDGRRFFVGPDELTIRINRDMSAYATETDMRPTKVGHCLAVHDGRVCRKTKGHTSPHDWEVYPLGATSLQ